MPSQLKVTVVTPSFNQASFIDQTIRSVVKQDHEKVEYIVIDGGSTDGSDKIISGYADRLAYWCCERDNGQSDAIRKGFERATGDILGWLNSDDILLPGALSHVVEFFEKNPEVECLSGGGYYIDAKGAALSTATPGYTLGVNCSYNRLRFYEMDGVLQQATFWRRSAYEAVGGIDVSLRFAMDLDLFIRLAKRRPIARTKKLLGCFRLHEDCKSWTIQDVRRTERLILAKRYGVADTPKWFCRMMYAQYRAVSLARKSWLTALKATGMVKLPAVPM
jgi:glycosyltransferase involved in cell wall biosynthesis